MSYQNLNISPRKIAAILAGTMLSLFLAALDNTVTGTAMPGIIRDLNGMDRYSWPFTAYLLLATSAVPVAGKLSDQFGRKIIVLCGIMIFLTASICCGLSNSMVMLTIFRAFQGIGGGILISSAFIIVAEIFPPKKRGKYIGMVASMFGLASLLGPVLGGFITGALSWRWVFFINLPFGIVAFTLIAAVLPPLRHHENSKSFDFLGMAAFLLSVIPMLLVFSEGGRSIPWKSPAIPLFLGLSAVMLTAFIIIEKNAKEPLLPLNLFKETVLRSSAISAFLAYAGMYGVIIFIPLLAQKGIGLSPVKSGMLLLPMTLMMMLGGNAGGRLAAKLEKFRLIGVSGFTLAFTGMSFLAFIGSLPSIAGLIAGAALIGLGIGIIMPVYNMAVQNVFPSGQLGIVSSMIEFFQNIGSVIAASLLGNLMQVSLKSMPVIDSCGFIFKACIPVMLAGIAVMAFLNNRSIREGIRKQSGLFIDQRKNIEAAAQNKN